MRTTLEHFPQKPRKFIRPLFFAAILFYFSFHALNGERGIYALFKQSHALIALQTELQHVTAQRTQLEHHVRLLGNQSLDLDLLDEQARSLVGMTRPDEVVVFSVQR